MTDLRTDPRIESSVAHPHSEAQLQALLELSRAFSEHLDLDVLLPLVLDRTKDALSAEASSVLLLDRERDELYFPATSSISDLVDERLRTLRFPSDRGFAGAVLRSGRPLLIADATKDARFYGQVDRETGQHTRDLICAPLRVREGVIGVVQVLNCREGQFGKTALDFLETLSGSIAIAIENATLYAAVRRSESHLINEVDGLRRERVHRERFSDIVGRSSAMDSVFSLMEAAIPSPITVLLEGDSGVGKELIATAIHRNGPRQNAPLVAVHCGALPATLLESELFGFCKGAFTGATQDKLGLFEAANGGTLFLDEIGEMGQEMQVKLLRAIQEREIRRLGETRTRPVDVRIISATHRDLAREVAEGRFREDLYYRISVFPIRVPPLRERREDIPALAAHFVERLAERYKKKVSGVAPDALERLRVYDWPGNIRQLQNEIERAVTLVPESAAIDLACLSERVAGGPGAARGGTIADTSSPLKQAREAFERDYVATALRNHDGNATHTARALGISRQMLHNKIKRYRLRESPPAPL